MASLIDDINNLDFEDLGSWPLVVKTIVIVLIVVAVIGGGIYTQTLDTVKALEKLEADEKELKETYKAKQGKAAKLDKYKKQLVQMELSFTEMLKQLPNQTEVADLLVDISQTGLANGLEFQLFRPKNENPREFYAELPIDIDVTGEYHDFAAFVSDVAALPRIVTIHSIKILPRSDTGKKMEGGSLTMKATAKTYRYLTDEEVK